MDADVNRDMELMLDKYASQQRELQLQQDAPKEQEGVRADMRMTEYLITSLMQSAWSQGYRLRREEQGDE